MNRGTKARTPASGPDSEGRCQDCKLPEVHCLCSEITRAACGVQLVVVRHALEAERNSNTGRLVVRALRDARLTDYGHPKRAVDLSLLDPTHGCLLYPSAGARPIARPRQLVLVDASWSQARRMVQKIPELRSMPKLALPIPVRPLPRLRAGKRPEQMSTAEAAIAALRHVGEGASADHLEALLRELVWRFAIPQRKGPNRSKSHD